MEQPTKQTRTAVRLGRAAEYRLMHLVETEYIKSGLNDTAFAAVARERLGDDRIKSSHIEGCRHALEIEAPSRVKNELSLEAMTALETRVSKIEGLLLAMQARLDRLGVK